MIAPFLFGALAAYGTPRLEPQIRLWLERLLPIEDIPAVEMRAIAFALMLFGASILAALLGSQNGVALTLGAIAGVLGPRGYNRYKVSKAPDYDS